MTSKRDIREEIKTRKWNRIGYVLRRGPHNIPRVSGTPAGKGNLGRRKQRWRRTGEGGVKEIRMSCLDVQKKHMAESYADSWWRSYVYPGTKRTR